jgi:DNA polymerase bacteriophage-type
MSIITLDFETFYRSAKNKGSIGPKYSLKDMTYEEYIRDPEFASHGVGIKIDGNATKYYPRDEVQDILHATFPEGNDHILIGHNLAFDAAILSWVFNLRAAKYYCTQSMSQALWAQGSASLASLAKRLWPTDQTKRKGNELISFDGIKTLSSDQQLIMGGYCINDVELTFNAFAEMFRFFPNEELDIIDLTIQMFAHPLFIVDRPLIEEYQSRLIARRAELVQNCGVPESVLGSNQQFAKYLKENHNIDVPIKLSPTKKNPNNTSLALAKDDVEFIELQAAHPTLRPLWEARIAITSSGELSRCERILKHSEISHINPVGHIAVPLKYCGAHTKRFSGSNKVNFQNFKRKSPLRYALTAPPEHVVIVRDLANIEGRMNAWFNGQDDKLQAFRDGRDIYNMVASDIYKRPIDRKLKAKDADGNYLDSKGNITTEENAFEPDELEGRVGKVAELGLGYQMGARKFLLQLFLAGVNCDLSFADMVVKTWRSKNANIVKGWAFAERVIFDMARKDLEPYAWGCIIVERERLRMPNGLYLTYPGLTYVETEENKGFEYWEGKFMKSLYGGLLIENVIQAISRIVMTDMMREINRQIQPYNARVVLTVHDEIVVIAPEQHADIVMHIMKTVMSTPPDWCNDGRLVLSSSGGYARNYSK